MLITQDEIRDCPNDHLLSLYRQFLAKPHIYFLNILQKELNDLVIIDIETEILRRMKNE